MPDLPAPQEPDAAEPALRPAVINAKAVFRIGTLLWAVALIVLGVLHFTGTPIPGHYPLIAAAGIVLGGLGYWWAHHNHLISDAGLSEDPSP